MTVNDVKFQQPISKIISALNAWLEELKIKQFKKEVESNVAKLKSELSPLIGQYGIRNISVTYSIQKLSAIYKVTINSTTITNNDFKIITQQARSQVVNIAKPAIIQTIKQQITNIILSLTSLFDGVSLTSFNLTQIGYHGGTVNFKSILTNSKCTVTWRVIDPLSEKTQTFTHNGTSNQIIIQINSIKTQLQRNKATKWNQFKNDLESKINNIIKQAAILLMVPMPKVTYTYHAKITGTASTIVDQITDAMRKYAEDYHSRAKTTDAITSDGGEPSKSTLKILFLLTVSTGIILIVYLLMKGGK